MQASLLVYALLLKSLITVHCRCDAVVLCKQIYKIISLNILPEICMTLQNTSSAK